MATFTASRNWCRANGISAALTQDSQRSAKDLLDELFVVMNSALVYSGNIIKSIPYDEVSGAGNGAIYVAPTASGPIIDLDDTCYAQQSENEPPVKYNRKRRADCDNIVAVEFVSRDNDYVHQVVSGLDAAAVSQFGPRKGGTLSVADLGTNNPSGAKQFLSISDPSVATKIANILAKRSGTGVNEYEVNLKPEYFWLESMDLVTITDARLGLNKKAVRITKMEEQQDRTWKLTADEFIYGLNHPDNVNVAIATGTLVNVNVDVQLVNAPIIFEPTIQMLNSDMQAKLAFIVSDVDPNYGGCTCYVSVDGGASYTQIVGNVPPCVTGELTADYPSHADPDTVDTLSIDISETNNGSISSVSQTIADGFSDQCYLEGVDVYSYEIVCPTTATPTGDGTTYDLTSYIRRGVLGSVLADHPSTRRFGVLANALTVDLPGSWIGVTLWFKFAAYNSARTGQNDLADCVAYSYTPRGLQGAPYTTNPQYVLSQAAADPTHLQTVRFTATWTDGKTASYLARNGGASPDLAKISIADPGTSPVTYYVSIYDPTRIGEIPITGTPTPLTLYCDTDPNMHANQPGYVFVGKIIATHAGGNTGSVAGPDGFNQVLVTVG